MRSKYILNLSNFCSWIGNKWTVPISVGWVTVSAYLLNGHFQFEVDTMIKMIRIHWHTLLSIGGRPFKIMLLLRCFTETRLYCVRREPTGPIVLCAHKYSRLFSRKYHTEHCSALSHWHIGTSKHTYPVLMLTERRTMAIFRVHHFLSSFFG